MIIWKKGDLFNSCCEALVNTVNCEGVMGKGIALEFKKRYPAMFEYYKKWCKEKHYGGDLMFWLEIIYHDNEIPIPRHDEPIWMPKPAKELGKTIICFATKESWRNKSKIEWIERGLQNLVRDIDYFNIPSIAIPKLGCNNGGLNWESQVKPLMIKYLENLPIAVEIYE